MFDQPHSKKVSFFFCRSWNAACLLIHKNSDLLCNQLWLLKPGFALLENMIKYLTFGVFLNTQHIVEITSLSYKENNWTSSQGTCLPSLPASTRVDKHDSQNIIAYFKCKKVLNYSGRQQIPFSSITHNHEFISLQGIQDKMVGWFSIIILSKSPAEVLFTKKPIDPTICQNGGRRGNHLSTILCHKPVTATYLKQNLLMLHIKELLTFFRSHVQILWENKQQTFRKHTH